MDWWQIVLIVLISIIMGLLVGGLLSYLIARLLRKSFVRRRETAAVVEGPLQSTAPDLLAEVENNYRIAAEPRAGKLLPSIARLLKKPFVKERETSAVVKGPLQSTAPDLLTEVENNHRIATEPWTGKLLSFQTGVWDTNPDEVHTLTANLREGLTQAYVDMRLANSIVWLSMELGRRSPNLDENYKKLCTSIATRLGTITPLLKWSGN